MTCDVKLLIPFHEHENSVNITTITSNITKKLCLAANILLSNCNYPNLKIKKGKRKWNYQIAERKREREKKGEACCC